MYGGDVSWLFVYSSGLCPNLRKRCSLLREGVSRIFCYIGTKIRFFNPVKMFCIITFNSGINIKTINTVISNGLITGFKEVS